MNIEQFTEKAREAIADASALAQQTPPLPPRVGRLTLALVLLR